MDEKPILNLDEVLGARILKVRYQGKEYPIRPVEALSPEEFGRMMAYGTKFQEMSAEQVEQNGTLILQAIDDMLEIIGPALPRYKPAFLERVKAVFKRKTYARKFALSVQESQAVMQFWADHNRKNSVRAGEPKKARIRG